MPNGVNEQDEVLTEIAAASSKVHPTTPKVTERCSRADIFDCDTNCNIETDKQKEQRISRVHLLSKVTLLINVSLTIAKFVASYLSGSLSIISSLVDSLVDITSGKSFCFFNKLL